MRKDGKLIKDEDPMHILLSYLLKRRCDSTALVTLNIPLDPIRSYTRRKRREEKPVSHLAVIIAAALRTIKEYPHMNRFVVGGKLYEHPEFSIAMMAMHAEDDEATMAKVAFSFDDDIFAVHQRIEQYIAESRAGSDISESDKITKRLLAIPGFGIFGAGILRFLDRHGLLPKSITDVSPFHSTMAVSNLASINTPNVFHHLFEVGTTSIFLTIGTEQYLPMRNRNEIVMTRNIPLSFTFDERICSGTYFAACFARFSFYLSKPELLEGPRPETS